MAAIKVLVVDDSALIRKLLTEMLSQDKDIEVVGTASDPLIARNKIKKLNPDVLTLDIEMPRMDGIAFLSNLMRLRPMPVVMISTLTEKGAPITLEALELGAVDYVAKPQDGKALSKYAEEIVSKVKTAAMANVKNRTSRQVPPTPKVEKNAPPVPTQSQIISTSNIRSNFVVAIGASTGGTEAIREVLLDVPKECPPIVVVQHIPGAFSLSFAERLNRQCEPNVIQVTNGEVIQPGNVYLAPGDDHMYLLRHGSNVSCHLNKKPPVNRHRPSVEVLFDSVAEVIGKNCLAIMLTGMGADGCEGMLKIKQKGGDTIAQDEASSVVWGMPGAVVEMGAANKVLPLHKIAEYIMKSATRTKNQVN